jgi:TolA-binding protein
MIGLKSILIFFVTILTQISFAVPGNPRANFNRDELVKELLGSSNDQSDMTLYSDIVSAYQANDQRKMKFHLQKMMKKFPQSSYADNALYLAGRQAMENKNYPEALQYFQKITKSYTGSNRYVTAQFAKAMTYKKMNLRNQARLVFSEIQKKFPGSPESLRAQNELKLIK